MATPVIYYVVVYFDRDDEGVLKPGEPREATHAWAAERAASFLARDHAGAIAFSRVGDPATGEFQDATIIALANGKRAAVSEQARVAALREILDRAYDKPAQPVEAAIEARVEPEIIWDWTPAYSGAGRMINDETPPLK
jgi:hypothetical protein